MKLSRLFPLFLVGFLIGPAAMTLAEAPPLPEGEPPSAETSTTEPDAASPAETAVEPSPSACEEVEADLDLELPTVPEFQRRIRTCDPPEAASIGCTEFCCVFVRNAPRCFC